jgi:monoamine oxidase
VNRADAIVVGAGLAGLRAARDLAQAGRSVVVLEARERPGGRALTATLGGRTVELGGSWFAPGQREVRSELERYGLAVRDYRQIRYARWLTAGELRHGLPVPWEDLGALEGALIRVSQDARALAGGDERLGRPSALEYVEALGPSPALRDYLLGWWQLMGGAPPERGAVADALAAIAAHGGLTGLVTCLAHGPADGWSRLAEALASSPGLDVRFGAAVGAIEDDGESIAATTTGGGRVTARAAIVAVPLNCLPAIRFVPDLPQQIVEAAGANAGAAVKVLMLARHVPPHGIAVGIGPGLNWLYADEERDGQTLVTGFGWQDSAFDPADRRHVERALGAFFPEAELVDWLSHDWIGDPASRGTWLTAPAGGTELVDPARFTPDGTLVLAGSDVSAEEAGWFEGALRSGARVARHIHALLG